MSLLFCQLYSPDGYAVLSITRHLFVTSHTSSSLFRSLPVQNYPHQQRNHSPTATQPGRPASISVLPLSLSGIVNPKPPGLRGMWRKRESILVRHEHACDQNLYAFSSECALKMFYSMFVLEPPTMMEMDVNA